jgi:hypothetical protein
MSDTALDYRRRIPRILRPSLTASASLIRWSLRITTVMFFSAATAIGVNLGMSAPEIPPTSVVQHYVAQSEP